MKTEIYHPREDTFLLEQFVRRHSIGSVLEIGTGSGYLANIAAKKARVHKVLAVDVNKQAIRYAQTKHHNPKIHYQYSDLFSQVDKHQHFDTIIFNPPYLPDDGNPVDPALIGGQEGNETILAFLDQAVSYLSINGQILLLISTHSKPDVIKERIHAYMLEISSEIDMAFPFETLYAWRITKTSAHKKLERRGIHNITYADKGRRGVVYTGHKGRKKVAIKLANPKSKAKNTIKHEAKILKKLNRYGIGPRFITAENEFLVREWAEGDMILDYIANNKKPAIKKMLRELFLICAQLDQHHIVKEEMHHPWKHVIIGKKVYLIDFERARVVKTHKNGTQFLQMVRSLKSTLAKKNIRVTPAPILTLAKKYAKNRDPEPIFAWIASL